MIQEYIMSIATGNRSVRSILLIATINHPIKLHRSYLEVSKKI